MAPKVQKAAAAAPAAAKAAKPAAKDSKAVAKTAGKDKPAAGGVKKAQDAKKAVQQGTKSQNKATIRTSIRFHKPKTLRLARKPKYPRRSAVRVSKLDNHSIIRNPLNTETAMKKIEDMNTLVFIVDKRANKPQIRTAVQRLYDVKVAKVNTLVRPDGQKKAFVRLQPDFDALDVANKIGII